MSLKYQTLAVDDDMDEDQIVRVSGSSDPNGVSIAISKLLYEHHEILLRCVGAAASNQALKAVAIARGYAAQKGVDLVARPGFVNIPSDRGDGSTITAMVLRLSVT